METCADCRRLIFGSGQVCRAVLHGFSRTVCRACYRIASARSLADNETRVLERIYALPSPPDQAQADGMR